MTVKILVKGKDRLVKMTEGASGYDIRSAESVELRPGDVKLVGTGVYMQIPDGYECQIRPRSGLASKCVVVLNSPGTIDSDYRGEVKVLLYSFNNERFIIREGDRIAQAVFTKVPSVELIEAETLDDTERGANGFGSTGGIQKNLMQTIMDAENSSYDFIIAGVGEYK